MDDPRKYMQIHATLMADITTGRLGPGKPCPSISVLSRDFKCSRNTVRKAYQILEDAAYVDCYPGIGYSGVPQLKLTPSA